MEGIIFKAAMFILKLLANFFQQAIRKSKTVGDRSLQS